MEFKNDIDFASQLDDNDNLKNFRQRFIIPVKDDKEQIYFLGNSLGLQPVNTIKTVNGVFAQWASLGVEGFFHGDDPWLDYHDKLLTPLAGIVGAKPSEVVVMNQLSVNLHLMMVSFYRPAGKKRKIICEAKAFPSDQYIFETHLKALGLDPDDVVIEVAPRKGEYNIRLEDIIEAIDDNAEELALVIWGGINYYTGQAFDIHAITLAAHRASAIAGFDLAHAAGNIRLLLHEWDVDFACWCSYKYLNSGPGAVGGVFINERFHKDSNLKRFAGWWGYEKSSRFKMEKGFVPIETAEGWQLSTPSMLLYACHYAALEIFADAGMNNILDKAALMSNYLHFLCDEIIEEFPGKMEFITPENQGEHGCQLSMFFERNGREVYEKLSADGIFADWREPGVIRIAPVPLYNTFVELFRFSSSLKTALAAI